MIYFFTSSISFYGGVNSNNTVHNNHLYNSRKKQIYQPVQAEQKNNDQNVL